MRKMMGLVVLAFTASVATAAPKMDIVQTAVSAGQFQTLVAAVKAAGLAETLEGKGPFTVFAPTDEAFQKLPPGTVESLLKPENKEKLRAILLYHVVPGRLDAAKVSHMTSAKTAQGSDLQFAASGGGVTVDGARVVKADIAATNGEIHVIDTVLMPPNQ
jgi:uncharacterized surface protein with fasciclin (FAS1) repeats